MLIFVTFSGNSFINTINANERKPVVLFKKGCSHTVQDLALWLEIEKNLLERFLNELSKTRKRILQSAQNSQGMKVYELFHEVLAEPIIEWRKAYLQKRDKKKKLLQVALDKIRNKQVEQGALLTRLTYLFYKDEQEQFLQRLSEKFELTTEEAYLAYDKDRQYLSPA